MTTNDSATRPRVASSTASFTDRLNRRAFLRRATALGLAVPASGVAPSVAARAQSPATVTVWSSLAPPIDEALRVVIDAYNAQATGHQAVLVQVSAAAIEDAAALTGAVASGAGPDVYLLDRFVVAQRAAEGLLQNLSALGAGELIGDYLDFAAAEATFNGEVYALPFNTDVRALFYNAYMLESVGVDPADLDVSNDPVSWDRVQEIARRLDETDRDGTFTHMGFIPWLNQGWHYTYGFSWGGDFFDAAACTVTPDDPAIVRAARWVQDYCVALGPERVEAFGGPSMQPGFDEASHPFFQGRLALQITGNWYVATMARYAPNIRYGVTWIPVPRAGDPSTTWAGGWSVVMPSGAARVESSWAFMRWFAGEPGQRRFVAASGQLPTISRLATDAALFTGADRLFAEQLLPIAKNRPPLPVGARYWDELTVAWQQIYLDQAEPGAALRGVKERVQPELQGFCPISTA